MQEVTEAPSAFPWTTGDALEQRVLGRQLAPVQVSTQFRECVGGSQP